MILLQTQQPARDAAHRLERPRRTPTAKHESSNPIHERALAGVSLVAGAAGLIAVIEYALRVWTQTGSITGTHAAVGVMLAVAVRVAARSLRASNLATATTRERVALWFAALAIAPLIAIHVGNVYWDAVFGPAPLPHIYRTAAVTAVAGGLASVWIAASRLLRDRRTRSAAALAGTSAATAILLVEVVWGALQPLYPGPRKFAAGGRPITRPIDERVHGYPYAYRADGVFREEWGSNPHGVFDVQNGLDYRINRLGLRGPLPDPTRTTSAVRIVFLGDSFTFGEGVREHETLPQQVAGLLSMKRGGAVECINGGVGGFDTRQEVALYRHRLAEFQPDAVVVVMTLNDRRPSSLREGDPLRRIELERLSVIVHRVRDAARIAAGLDAAHTIDDYHPCFTALRELHGRLSHRQCLLVALYPYVDVIRRYPYRALHEQITTRLQSDGIDALDLLPTLEALPGSDLTVHPYQDTHPNAPAHAAAARVIADWLHAKFRAPASVRCPMTTTSRDRSIGGNSASASRSRA